MALLAALAMAALGGGGGGAEEEGLGALLEAARTLGGGAEGLDALVAEAEAGAGEGEWERRRAQFGFDLGDIGTVGQEHDACEPPVFSFGGVFVDDAEGQSSEGTQGRMRSDPGSGVFVDAAMLSFNESAAARALDQYMQGASYPNTTVAEIHYKLIPCGEPLCRQPPGTMLRGEWKGPNGYNGRGLDQGVAVDRAKSSGVLFGGGGVVIDQYGPMIFETFMVLVDLTQRGANWQPSRENDVLAVSKVMWLNITVLPGVSSPVFDPPQDFYSAAINVTLESVSDNAHVFFTLQPPFISDKAGTWCPKMGSWCTQFASGGTFHAVPDQRPNFLYSQRGLFTRMFDVRSNETWSAPIPASFPFGANLTAHAEEHNSVEFMERFATDGPLLIPAEGEPWYRAENISLYPMYTAEKYPGGWVLFEPMPSQAVEEFVVDVSTCYNHSYLKTVTINGQNHSSNVTELECEHVMHVPAANPCPWSRDCKLLGEVSFKLRAYALRTDYVASKITSGLYTFIQAGFPQWMNTRDDCGGWRRSTVNPYLSYAVAEDTVWDVLAPYDCPPGWHWASSAEGVAILGYEGDQAVAWAPNVSEIWDAANPQRHQQRFERHFAESEDGLTMTYSDSCGWAELEWEGKDRRFFRFSDSGPRYQNYVRSSLPLWPDEAHLFVGERPDSRMPRGQNEQEWRDHIMAWRWYEHNENFSLSVPYELPALYDPPTDGTWAMKAADSLDYLGLEMWSGDQLGNQPDFAGAVCRTNGDWTPPRVVILGPLIVTLEVHTPYVEYGAQAWDPVDDLWYPEWKTFDGIDDDLDDGVVRITGHVDYNNVGVYYMYYDATDLHGNDAVQQVRTIIIVDRTIPVLTVTEGMHQRVCEPLTQHTCTEPFLNMSYNGLTSQPCPARHTCSTLLGSWDPPRQFGYINPSGERTGGTQITIEVGTQYVELGATATDNLKRAKKLTENIQRHEVGPLKHRTSVRRVYPLYPEYWRINKALKKYKSELFQSIGGAAGAEAADAVTAQDVIDLGLVEDANEYGLRMLANCQEGGGEAPGPAGGCKTGSCNLGRYTEPTDIWSEQYEITTSRLWDADAEEFVHTSTMPNYCRFDWGSDTVGVEPNVDDPAEDGWLTFETNATTVWFEDGYEFPCTLSKEQPHIEFDFVNYNLPGVYNVTYDVRDDFNNTADTVWRTVTVKDSTPPVLHLEGDPIMFVRHNTSFVDPGATASDTGDDYYYDLNRMNISACEHGKCTTEHVNKSINDKIVTRVHHERLDCERKPLYSPRNETPPICLMARMSMNTADTDHETAFIECPSGQIISGYNFISYGRPEGSCEEQQYEPLTPSEDCFLTVDTEIGEKVPADVAMFEHECVGRVNCTLSSDWEYYNPSQFGGFLDGEDYGAVDPCPGQLKWLLVEATCAYNSTEEPIGYYVECRDENVQIPRLGVSTQPPLTGELDRSLPGTKPGQYPLDRFDGTWKNMDDFLSRLDPGLAAANEKYVHQNIWGENKFLRTRIRDELFVDTSINLLTLGLYVITYDVTDMAGNEATQITRFVIVQDDSELYQNSIQQVYDGTDGTFTGGVLPHEVGGTVRVASEVMELSRNRPTAASSLWGVHTPSSSAVDGLYENAYVMPFLPMDEYGRTLAQDHIPNIFMSGPADWQGEDPPTDPQWWMVHLSSYTDNPTVVVYTRDCCTEQFGGTLDIYLTSTATSPTAASNGNETRAIVPCSTMGAAGEELTPNGVFETVCEASGEYLFIVGGPWIHFAEVEVFGMGGGNGHGHYTTEEKKFGYRKDVGLHHEGAQYAITLPVANVTSDWWVGVPSISGRQLVLELNTTWPGETRSVRADIHHALQGGLWHGHEVWNMTATGELRRKADGHIYDGVVATLIDFSVRESSDAFVQKRVEYVLTYASLDGTPDSCTCDHDLERQEGIACEVQCPLDMSKPRLSNLRTASTGYVTSVTAEVPAAYSGAFAAAWGKEWLANTLGVAVENILGLRVIEKDGWRDMRHKAAPESSLVLDTYPTGQSRVVLGCGPRDDDLREGRYFLSVHSAPLYKTDSILRSSSYLTGKDTVHTSKVAEAEHQAVPYSIRATYIEPILLPSAVDVSGTTSADITTVYYFEVYLNQKIALELAGSEDAEDGVSAVLSYAECTDRDDDFGYLGKGRLQTYKAQSDRPPGYDFLSYCPIELRPGRYYVEMRASKPVDYTLRLSEYTPYCPNNCTGGLGHGDCDCTILRCICQPGYYGDDCSDHPAVPVVESYPFMEKSTTLAHQGGGEPGRGTVFNQTCPEGYVVVGLTGSYYDHYNPKSYMGQLVRRVNLICQPLLGYGVLGTRSNETEIVTNNHSLSIYSRTLSRYSERQEYLSPEQLDLDCITPGGKGHLDECRLLHGIWSAQQTIYTEDEKQYAWTCGPNEIFVGQTVDVLPINQTCEEDGFGCKPKLKLCEYTLNEESFYEGGGHPEVEQHSVTIPCYELCEYTEVLDDPVCRDLAYCIEHNRTTTSSFTFHILCNDTRVENVTSPWAQAERDSYWPGNDWDWRSQKSFGEYPNDYYDTFRSDLVPGRGDLLSLARDLLLIGSDFNSPFEYKAPSDDFEGDGRYAGSSVENAGRRRLEAWGAIERLHRGIELQQQAGRVRRLQGLGGLEALDAHIENVTTQVTEIGWADVPSPHRHEYITEVGGICEKLSFAHNTSAPGAAVHVRYEDDRHYPVDKVVGAGAQDTTRSMQGCSGDSCPSGDRSDPAHNKHRCPAGSIVTGVVTRSGDWLDSIQFVCSPIFFFNAEEWKLYQLNIDAEEQARMQETLDKLEQLAELAQLAQLGNLGSLGR